MQSIKGANGVLIRERGERKRDVSFKRIRKVKENSREVQRFDTEGADMPAGVRDFDFHLLSLTMCSAQFEFPSFASR